jgi:uncharacterized protein YidB (DUF937 family)
MGILDLMMNEFIATPGDPLGVVLGRLVGGGAGQPDAPQGGLAVLLARFEAAGLGNIAQSWVGTGPNLPITAEQLHHVLGEEQVTDLSRQSGLQARHILPMLAEHLPAVVDRMTPNGQLPDEGALGPVSTPPDAGPARR